MSILQMLSECLSTFIMYNFKCRICSFYILAYLSHILLLVLAQLLQDGEHKADEGQGQAKQQPAIHELDVGCLKYIW